MSPMACGCAKRRKKTGNEAPPVPVGPRSRVRFYAVDPSGDGHRYDTLVEARRAVRSGGRGWYVEGRRELVDA